MLTTGYQLLSGYLDSFVNSILFLLTLQIFNVPSNMFCVKHYITTDNNWLVRKYEIFQSTDGGFVEKFVPRADISIIFHFKSVPRIVGTSVVPLQPFFIAPIVSESLLLNLDDISDTFVIICNPTALSRIFKLDLTPQAKPDIDLPHQLFYPLWETMSELETTEERIACFERFLSGLQQSTYLKDAIDILYDKIMEKGMHLPLKEIVRECHASQRTLERHFVKRTGVTPKMLVRIMRFNALWNKVQNNKKIDYQNVVATGNYFDQAHFINDFKSIVGESPGNFFKRDLHSIKMMSGQIDGSI